MMMTQTASSGREIRSTPLKPYKFGSGRDDFSYVLSGPIDDIINLENLRPSVSVSEPDGYSFASTVRISGQAWDGAKWPYANDNIATQSQFGLIKRVEIQPPGSTDWFYGIRHLRLGRRHHHGNHPFKNWVYEWDMSAHPEGEGDITFRIRSYDGLDYSPIEVRQYKLNLVAPTLLVDVPTEAVNTTPEKFSSKARLRTPIRARTAVTSSRFGSPSRAKMDSHSSSSSRFDQLVV